MYNSEIPRSYAVEYIIENERHLVITTAWDGVTFAEARTHQELLKHGPDFITAWTLRRTSRCHLGLVHKPGHSSGSSLNSGVMSVASDLAFNGMIIQSGPFATLTFDIGSFTGSLQSGGSFTSAMFALDNGSAVLFQSS